MISSAGPRGEMKEVDPCPSPRTKNLELVEIDRFEFEIDKRYTFAVEI